MKPILFSLGPLPIYSFGVLVALGVLAFLYFGVRRARRDGFPQVNDVYDAAFVILLTGFLGARIFYVIQYWDLYLQNPGNIFALWEGGLIFYGGVIGAFLGTWIFLKIKKIPVLKGFDFLLPLVALTHAFGRIGCFLAGCCGGKICPFTWCVQFPGAAAAVYPTQLIEAGYNFFLFAFLYGRYPRKKFDGEIMLLYFMLYAAGRFVIEFWRDNPFWGFLTQNQWLSILLFAVSTFFFWQKGRKTIILNKK
jgi:phosphatidylglycerol:prolipoprotein diacylglycerol transferase